MQAAAVHGRRKRRKYGAATPYELLHRLLSAGELEELSQQIERLSGYRKSVTELVEDVAKK